MFGRVLITIVFCLFTFQVSQAEPPKKKRKLSRIQRARMQQQQRMRRDRNEADSLMMRGMNKVDARKKVLSKQRAPKQKLKKVYKKVINLKEAKKKAPIKEETFEIDEDETSTVSVLDAYDDQGNLKQKPKPKEEPKEEEGSVLDSYLEE